MDVAKKASFNAALRQTTICQGTVFWGNFQSSDCIIRQFVLSLFLSPLAHTSPTVARSLSLYLVVSYIPKQPKCPPNYVALPKPQPYTINTKHPPFASTLPFFVYVVCTRTGWSCLRPALQPWTPCLPIRGGKLKTSKYYSTSNPQLPFMCPPGGSAAPVAALNCPSSKNNSSSSLNSSYIWREANPNNFNVYSTSVSSLNSSYRHSLGQNAGGSPPERRSAAEDKTTMASPAITPKKQSLYHQLKNKTISNYENVYMTPLLPARKHKTVQPTITTTTRMWHNSPVIGTGRQRSDSPTPAAHSPPQQSGGGHYFGRVGGLYDRRVNRSFEAPPPPDMKMGPLRRSTPHLAEGNELRADGTARHSATWCCGNFVLKQWRKMHNYD